jgi:hypothetical protein
MSKQNKKLIRGITLIETLFGISIFVIIMTALGTFTKDLWVYNSYIGSGLSTADSARSLLKKMTLEIRTASTADTGAYTINSATSTSFIFYSDVDDDGLKEKVRYFLNGTTLQRGIIKPTGSPLGYTATETISTLMPNVANSIIFEYYDENYDGETSPLSIPVNIPSVRLIKITVTTDNDPNKPPAPSTFSTQISMRNLKDNL